MPTIYFLIGVPASGKSTWVDRFFEEKLAANENWYDYEVLSTDSLVEAEAKIMNSTYNQTWPKYIDTATKIVDETLSISVGRNVDIIWDQTNLTAKSRAKKLTKIPNNYRKIAVYFRTPKADEHKRRLESRAGKTVPQETIDNMIKTIEFPTIEEGFNEIWVEGEYHAAV